MNFLARYKRRANWRRVHVIPLLCIMISMYFLWDRGQNYENDLRQLAFHCASQSYGRFQDYLERGSEYDYHYGVAELNAFYNAYTAETTRTEESSQNSLVNRQYFNQLLGELMKFPKLTPEQKGSLVNICFDLSRGFWGSEVFDRMFQLYNELARE